MTVELANRQEKLPIDTRQLKTIAERILQLLKLEESELSIVLVSDEGIHNLNREYRDIDRPTDVLSFPLRDNDGSGWEAETPFLGDVVLSVETAARQAEDRDKELGGVGYSTVDELTFLLVHGVLHLLGHDHMESVSAQRMEAEEKRLFSTFSSHPPRAHHVSGDST